ncbi:hypothetical protein [Mesorhizobium sp. M0571]|uniref:hypothetical protein n=1 Tax=Mesorhizobium sp. M0571 TaxID=2956960 RepID=UPI00333AE8BE
MNDKFGVDIDAAVAATPISKKLLIAMGIQETFYIWAKMYKNATAKQVLELCVGDTIDFPRRATWPKSRAELEAHPKGAAMFKAVRTALEKIAAVNSGYKTVLKNPNKFCHGFGMFQYDIQFFRSVDPDYFLIGDWKTWNRTLSKGITELKDQMAGLYGAGKASLTHDESVYLAIAYNQGAKRTKNHIATKKFKQGHKDGNGVFYGEHTDATS